MSEKERLPISPDAERSGIPAQPESRPPRETRELLEKPPAVESEETSEARIDEIRQAFQEPSDEGGTAPQPIAQKSAEEIYTKMDTLYHKLFFDILKYDQA